VTKSAGKSPDKLANLRYSIHVDNDTNKNQQTQKEHTMAATLKTKELATKLADLQGWTDETNTVTDAQGVQTATIEGEEYELDREEDFMADDDEVGADYDEVDELWANTPEDVEEAAEVLLELGVTDIDAKDLTTELSDEAYNIHSATADDSIQDEIEAGNVDPDEVPTKKAKPAVEKKSIEALLAELRAETTQIGRKRIRTQLRAQGYKLSEQPKTAKPAKEPKAKKAPVAKKKAVGKTETNAKVGRKVRSAK